MRIAVTGATGFLGSALVRALEQRGDAVVALHSRNCDLRSPASLPTAATGQFDRVYHLAAWTQAGDFCLRHPGEQWIINQQINTNLLTWWQRDQPQAKLICIGTSCAYDEALPHAEENYLTGLPTPSLFTYAMTKRMLYTGLLALSRQFGLKYLHVIPSTLYGPGYHTDGRQMHFIFDLMRKILRAGRTGEPAVLWGDGSQRREIVHVDDFVAIMGRLADEADNDIFNIGAGVDHSIREFGEMLCRLAGVDSALVQYDTSKYVGAKQKLLKNDKLMQRWPDLKFRPLEMGLAETMRWMRETLPDA